MQTSKLFLVLKQLKDDERARFREFVGSPYFNKNKELIVFLDLILKERLYDGEILDKKRALKKIYRGESYPVRRINDITYLLMNLLEEFLSNEKYKRNSFQQKINIMGLAYEKELSHLINGIERDIEQLHAMHPIRDSNYFYESFMIHSERDYSFRLLGKISDNDSLQSKADQLDLFYFAVKLKDSCEMLNRSRIVTAKYDFKMLDPTVDYLISNPGIYKEHSAIHIYLYIYLMLSSENHETYFNDLVPIIKQNESVFLREELRAIYAYPENYCIRRINQGSPSFYQNLFDLYRHIHANGLVFDENKNVQWDFKNFVTIGLRLKEYEWTFEIINAFKDHLPDNIRDNAHAYNLANYYYETGDYKKATKLLNSVEFTDIYYNLDSKAMLLKIYYKVEEEESFYSLVSSFSIYLKRNKLISRDNAEVYENLIRFTKKAFLLKIKLPYQRNKDYFNKIGVFKIKINEARRVANINWLLQELELLQKTE
jgi:hypothetical protein